MNLFEYRKLWEEDNPKHQEWMKIVTQWNAWLKTLSWRKEYNYECEEADYLLFENFFLRYSHYQISYFEEVKLPPFIPYGPFDYDETIEIREKERKERSLYNENLKAIRALCNEGIPLSGQIPEWCNLDTFHDSNSMTENLWHVWLNVIYINPNFGHTGAVNLGYLPNLKYLVINHANGISSQILEFIQSNKNLIGLSLMDCCITDFGGLEDQSNLRLLNVSNNTSKGSSRYERSRYAKDLSQLKGYESLEKINISHCYVEDLSPLLNLPNLKEIIFNEKHPSRAQLESLRCFLNERKDCTIHTNIDEKAVEDVEEMMREQRAWEKSQPRYSDNRDSYHSFGDEDDIGSIMYD